MTDAQLSERYARLKGECVHEYELLTPSRAECKHCPHFVEGDPRWVPVGTIAGKPYATDVALAMDELVAWCDDKHRHRHVNLHKMRHGAWECHLEDMPYYFSRGLVKQVATQHKSLAHAIILALCEAMEKEAE